MILRCVLFFFLAIVTGCASMLAPIDRHIERGNVLLSTAEPEFKVQVDSSIPFLGSKNAVESLSYRLESGGSSASFDVYIFAKQSDQYVGRSVEVAFAKLHNRGSYWIKEIPSSSNVVKKGLFEHPIGTFYTALRIFRDGRGHGVVDDLLSRSGMYWPTCMVGKQYLHVVKAISTAKVLIFYNERIDCFELDSYFTDYGLTKTGNNFFEGLSRRADDSINLLTIDELPKLNAPKLSKSEEEALKSLLVRAKNGDAEAMFEISDKYDFADGVPQDYSKSAYWLQRAAELNHAEAQCNLGGRYDAGLGLPKNKYLSYRWHWLCKNNKMASVKVRDKASSYVSGAYNYGPLTINEIKDIETEAAKWLSLQ